MDALQIGKRAIDEFVEKLFQDILVTSKYPGMWKLANVTPMFIRVDKQLIEYYRPVSLLPICGKIFEKIIFNNLYSYLNANNLIVAVFIQKLYLLFGFRVNEQIYTIQRMVLT